MVRHLTAIALAFGLAVLAAGPAAARELPAIAARLDCPALARQVFWAGSNPARVSSAKVVSASGAAAPYCEVLGYVAPQVRFELRLPQQGWRQRMLFTGCGGMCGFVSVRPYAAAGCAPLERGEFAVVASDLGHSANAGDALWASGNPQGIRDFGNRGVHVVAQAAKQIIAAYYGQAPQFSYFSGCSDGGREGMMAAQRYPGDFDGIIAGAPVVNHTANNSIHHAWITRNLLGPDRTPLIGDELMSLLHGEVLRQCDGIDQQRDGLISDPARCRPALTRITCTARSKGLCLSGEQAAWVMALYAGPVGTGGQLLYVGLPPGSEESWNRQAINSEGYARNFITWLTGGTAAEEANAWKAGYDPAALARYNTNANELNALNPDLKSFAARGGRLIVWHGWADASVPAASSLAYVASVRAALGGAKTADFLRLYMLPGVGHCGGGKGPDRINLLDPLMAWVEDGVVPAAIAATSAKGPAQRLIIAPYAVP